jgi:hypothetical protein
MLRTFASNGLVTYNNRLTTFLMQLRTIDFVFQWKDFTSMQCWVKTIIRAHLFVYTVCLRGNYLTNNFFVCFRVKYDYWLMHAIL